VLSTAGEKLPKPGSSYNPHTLLAAVTCIAPHFKGQQQHDSHELLRLLLDGLQVRQAPQQMPRVLCNPQAALSHL